MKSKLLDVVRTHPKARHVRMSYKTMQIIIGAPPDVETLREWNDESGNRYILKGRVLGIEHTDGRFEIDLTTLELEVKLRS